MALKVTLKPGEKFVINGAVVVNGDRRSNLVIQNRVSILREKDIMLPQDADTPVKRIYFAIMMMYLDGKYDRMRRGCVAGVGGSGGTGTHSPRANSLMTRSRR